MRPHRPGHGIPVLGPRQLLARPGAPLPASTGVRSARAGPPSPGGGGGVLPGGAARSGPGWPRGDGDRDLPGGRPQRGGSRPRAPRFLTDPNMASAAARDDDTSPRRGRPRDRGRKRSESFVPPPAPNPNSQPAKQPAGPSTPYPAGRRQRRQKEPAGPRPGRRPADSVRPRVPTSRDVWTASGPAQPARSRRGGRAAQPLAGDAPAPPGEPHNGCRAWPLPCARRARPRVHARRERAGTSTPTPLAALSRQFPRPAPPGPSDALRGRGLGRRPHPPGASAWRREEGAFVPALRRAADTWVPRWVAGGVVPDSPGSAMFLRKT